MEWALLFIFGFTIMPALSAMWYFIGKRVGRNEPKNIDYKERWQETSALLQSVDLDAIKPEQRKEIEAATGKGSGSATKTLNYHKLAGWQRVDLELDRLAAGLAPRDDLQGLAGWQVVDIEERRLKKGWIQLDDGRWAKQ